MIDPEIVISMRAFILIGGKSLSEKSNCADSPEPSLFEQMERKSPFEPAHEVNVLLRMLMLCKCADSPARSLPAYRREKLIREIKLNRLARAFAARINGTQIAMIVWYLWHCRVTKAQASMRKYADSPEPSLVT